MFPIHCVNGLIFLSRPCINHNAGFFWMEIGEKSAEKVFDHITWNLPGIGASNEMIIWPEHWPWNIWSKSSWRLSQTEKHWGYKSTFYRGHWLDGVGMRKRIQLLCNCFSNFVASWNNSSEPSIELSKYARDLYRFEIYFKFLESPGLKFMLSSGSAVPYTEIKDHSRNYASKQTEVVLDYKSTIIGLQWAAQQTDCSRYEKYGAAGWVGCVRDCNIWEFRRRYDSHRNFLNCFTSWTLMIQLDSLFFPVIGCKICSQQLS